MSKKQINNSLISNLEMLTMLIKTRKQNDLASLRTFIQEYYLLEEELPQDFYELLQKQINSDKYYSILKVIMKRDIYTLISHLKHNDEDVTELDEVITQTQYYDIPQKHINRIIELLKSLNIKNPESNLNKVIEDELLWKLKRLPIRTEEEYRELAYKMYLSIGYNNTIELLENRNGKIDYNQVYFLFSKLNTKKAMTDSSRQIFTHYLFGNKKDFNNTIHQMLTGDFPELFLNFDYFYTNFNYFINKLGTKLPKDKLTALLKERYIPRDVSLPEITGDLLDDMISSYYCRFETLDTPEQEIFKKNFDTYNEYLKKKYTSSIPQLTIQSDDSLTCEVLKLNDPRNLVLGYRSGNCFRLNGDASILFHNFLKSPHMRLVSISTPENKDYAMMLVMRNGNVLIGQGIEVSKRATPEMKGKKLYDACRQTLKELMNEMNSTGDEIVATIIGSSNENVSRYNNQVLPFLVRPILESSGNYYNGIYNYQCLLDLKEGKTTKDIKLYTPETRYYDEREPILRRLRHNYDESDDYMEIEKRLIALRFSRMQESHNFTFYQTLTEHNELYTCCNKDWYITLFDDGTVDSFITDTTNEKASTEYNQELAKVYQKVQKPKK